MWNQRRKKIAWKTLVDKNGHHVPPLPPSSTSVHHPHEGPRAQAFTPDVMEPVEIRAFPQFYRVYETQGKWHCPRLEVYCLMRNIILGLWFQNCKSYLTDERCVEALSLRGLLRIWSSLHLSAVLHFLTLHGFVNHGFLDDIPRPLPFLQSDRKIRVLIIGAGTAGIAAANHLRNYGHTVRILEAQGELGGRVRDDFSLGPCVGMGAMFITGICNNPFTLLAEQLGIPLRVVDEDRCDLVTEGQGKVDGEADLQVEKHFNRTLDLLADWRIGQNWDVPLQTKLEELHTTVLSLEQVSQPYTAEEKSLLDFHYSNLEFACGAQLSQISSLNWDHNDTFSQFSGPHAILPTGYHAILTGMVRGIDIAYHTTVETVEVVGEGVRLGDQNGQFWEADKVAIRFSEPFWRQSLGNCDFFGRVASNTDSRGMFGMFYDMSSVWSPSNSDSVGTTSETKTEGPTSETRGPSVNSPTEGSFILLTTISGKALLWYHAASDGEIVDSCLKTLRLMFGTSAVLEVQGYQVSRWGSEPHVGMFLVSVGGHC
ncbi:Lysine-specific histone demethylase 1B [Geodia barretti]|uniref:Lysine-specific histone demethylase 1B n=1 Tax=Geodia barretti TaxID=519541 RepID=A0AA35WKT0_GEOBA|nr:Lysine-specific histone demethylase 1B [Geodia barretti]